MWDFIVNIVFEYITLHQNLSFMSLYSCVSFRDQLLILIVEVVVPTKVPVTCRILA
jgi:hypothetical protein